MYGMQRSPFDCFSNGEGGGKVVDEILDRELRFLCHRAAALGTRGRKKKERKIKKIKK